MVPSFFLKGDPMLKPVRSMLRCLMLGWLAPALPALAGDRTAMVVINDSNSPWSLQGVNSFGVDPKSDAFGRQIFCRTLAGPGAGTVRKIDRASLKADLGIMLAPHSVTLVDALTPEDKLTKVLGIDWSVLDGKGKTDASAATIRWYVAFDGKPVLTTIPQPSLDPTAVPKLPNENYVRILKNLVIIRGESWDAPFDPDKGRYSPRGGTKSSSTAP
jgi:hypothetical protein